jgi:hypothetical protein
MISLVSASTIKKSGKSEVYRVLLVKNSLLNNLHLVALFDAPDDGGDDRQHVVVISARRSGGGARDATPPSPTLYYWDSGGLVTSSTAFNLDL